MILVFGACHALGEKVAAETARLGARVIVIDTDGRKLTRIAAQDPDRIETLHIADFQTNTSRMLKEAWGDQPIRLVINLMPLAQPMAITEQMRILAAILRTTAPGLAAGKGALVSLVARPDDELALVGHGMLAAVKSASAILGKALRKSGVRIHVLTLPKTRLEVALPALTGLMTDQARQMGSTALDLD